MRKEDTSAGGADQVLLQSGFLEISNGIRFICVTRYLTDARCLTTIQDARLVDMESIAEFGKALEVLICGQHTCFANGLQMKHVLIARGEIDHIRDGISGSAIFKVRVGMQPKTVLHVKARQRARQFGALGQIFWNPR